MSDYIRGVLTTGAGGYGYIQSMSWAGEADEDMARDEQGITKYYDPFNALANLTVTVRFDRETDTEDLGYMFTIMGAPSSKFNGRYIQTAPPNLDETNVEGPSMVLTVRRYIDGGVPAAS